MIDYDATLQMFFSETIKYLERLRTRAKDKIYADRITAAIDVVQRIAANPTKYADYAVRAREGLDNGDLAMAFIPQGSHDNSVYLSFSAVLNSMGELNDRFDWNREKAQQKLLAALKTVKYKNSTSKLKVLTFKFKSPKDFAIQSNKQYQI